MGFCLCSGGMLGCSFGMTPAPFNALPTSRVMIGGVPAGVMGDMTPMVNIPPFGMCRSLTNPTVAAATAAALGVLTPMPCVPVPAGPWTSAAQKVSIGGQSALTGDSALTCAWGGRISVQFPGQVGVMAG